MFFCFHREGVQLYLASFLGGGLDYVLDCDELFAFLPRAKSYVEDIKHAAL